MSWTACRRRARRSAEDPRVLLPRRLSHVGKRRISGRAPLVRRLLRARPGLLCRVPWSRNGPEREGVGLSHHSVGNGDLGYWGHSGHHWRVRSQVVGGRARKKRPADAGGVNYLHGPLGNRWSSQGVQDGAGPDISWGDPRGCSVRGDREQRASPHVGAQMDLVTNRVNFRSIGVDMKMTNLPTGHRAIPLVQWSGEKFPVPKTAKEQFGLEDDAFMKKDSVLSAYIKGNSVSRSISSRCASQRRVVFNFDEPNYDTAQELCHRLPPPREERERPSALSSGAQNPSVSQCRAVLEHGHDVSVEHACSITHGHDESLCPPPRHEGSTALMGNATAVRRSQFDSFARRLEHGTPSATEEATRSLNAPVNRWRQLMLRMMYLFEAIRTRYFRLAERENYDKSILSDRRKFLVADSQAPATCLHPPPHIRRANQYATWLEAPSFAMDVMSSSNLDLGEEAGDQTD